MSMLQGNLYLVSNEARQDAKWTVPVALCMRLEAFMDIFASYIRSLINWKSGS